MDYQKIAIGLWIGLSIILFLLTIKSVLRQPGTVKRKKLRKVEWRVYLFMVAVVAAFISIAITLLIRYFFN